MSMSRGDWSLTWEQRFWRRVQKTDGCWFWLGGRGGRGGKKYGVYMLPGQVRRGAHVIAYERAGTSVPPGLVVDHLCSNPLCVRPDHLEAVTPQENRRRQRDRLTHCKRHHPLTGENLYVDKRGHRGCVTCRRMTSAQWQRERRAA